MADLPRVTTTPIPGLLVIELPLPGDNRGWFKENWQREKLVALGVPDLRIVQNNVSFNAVAGVTRGIHAEPWDKYVSVAAGRVFGAWVDLRQGDTFGAIHTAEIGPDRAVFVPRGVGNAFQALDDGTAYSYLVNDHWSPTAPYSSVNLADGELAIPWPIPLDRAQISEKDRAHPRLSDVTPMARRRTLVLGGDGQLGRALRDVLPDADVRARSGFDLDDPASFDAVPWRQYDAVVNAAAFTGVDAAETPEGRVAAWRVNVTATQRLARVAAENDLTLVQVSSDYVYGGTTAGPIPETEPVSPLGVYGQTKAAADAVAATVPRHYIVRTSWVVGDGPNFVRTMADLAERGVDPIVVEDQIGRLTFAGDLAAGIRHLLDSQPAFGVYHLTNSGEPRSWKEYAARVFELRGHDPARVTGTSTAEYVIGKVAAPRPVNSVLDLTKIQATGYRPPDADEALIAYLATL